MTREKNTTQPIGSQKIYSDLMIYICSFFGGILITGYMVAHNFAVFGQRDKIAPTWIITIVATLLSITLIIFTPNMSFIAELYSGLLISLITIFIVRKIQGKNIAQHFADGGLSYRWTRAALILGIWYSIMILIAIVLIIFDIDI